MRTRNARGDRSYLKRYSVTRDGRIFGPRGVRKLQVQGSGYHGITYRDYYGHMHVLYLHRFLAETYLPRPPDTDCVNHIDGDKLNNDLNNLEWTSKADDLRHAYRTGLMARDKGQSREANGRFLPP